MFGAHPVPRGSSQRAMWVHNPAVYQTGSLVLGAALGVPMTPRDGGVRSFHCSETVRILNRVRIHNAYEWRLVQIHDASAAIRTPVNLDPHHRDHQPGSWPITHHTTIDPLVPPRTDGAETATYRGARGKSARGACCGHVVAVLRVLRPLAIGAHQTATPHTDLIHATACFLHVGAAEVHIKTLERRRGFTNLSADVRYN